MAYDWAHGRNYDLAKIRGQYQNVTETSLRQAAAKLFRGDQMGVGVYGDVSNREYKKLLKAFQLLT